MAAVGAAWGRRARGGARKKGAKGNYESATGQKFWMQKQEAEGREVAVCYICAVL